MFEVGEMVRALLRALLTPFYLLLLLLFGIVPESTTNR